MVDVARASREIAKLTALKFFPADKEGRLAIVQQVCEMATDNEQIEWVVAQMLNWYNEWPGPKEMRGVFCQRWRPAMGANVNCSSVFPSGVFPGNEAAPVQAIGQAEARKLLGSIYQPLPERGERAEIAAPASVDEKRIGQEEIDAAVRQLRNQRGRRELGK